MPERMTAAYVTALGPAELIRVGPLPVPAPGPTDALVAVEAVAVNQVDTLIRSGSYPTPTPFPFVVGRDLVGTVREVGPGVAGFRPGDRVWCNSLGHDGRQGSFAELAVVPAERLYRLPAGADPVLAVAVAHPAGTAFLGWFGYAGLRAGQSVYVGGAAGNVGTAATQMAAAAGARVVAGARPEDWDACRAAGAAAVVDYRDPALADRLREAAPDGLDVFWNTSGNLDLDVAAATCAVGATILVSAGFDARPELPLRALYTRNVGLRGFVISRATAADLAAAAGMINGMLAEGRLTARIHAELPLAETAEAHRRVEQGVHGRIILRP
jgi:NADPH:quinone reductase-like Zn-dependent oxidoreductase